MVLQGRILQAPAGLIGFDTTDRLNPATAKQYFNKGYRYCVRYLSHNKNAKSHYDDLSADEAQAILDSGMALFAVKHPLRSGWVPTARLGHTFGANAAAYAGDAGLPAGVNVFLDLEGVKNGVSASDVIDFCNAWFAEVEGVGYETGVYIGAAPGTERGSIVLESKNKALLEGWIEL